MGTPGLRRSGPMDSVHAIAISTTASPARDATLVLFTILPPWSERSDVEGPALRPSHACSANHKRVAIPGLVDAQIRESRDSVHRRHSRRAGQCAGDDEAAVLADGDGHRAVEAGTAASSSPAHCPARRLTAVNGV